MSSPDLRRGAIVVANLDPIVGHEQRGLRPCIVASSRQVAEDQRFPLICVIPVTGTPGQGLLYPRLEPAKNGLSKTSFAMIDHLRSIDKRRIRRVGGSVSQDELAAIDRGLSAFLGLARLELQ